MEKCGRVILGHVAGKVLLIGVGGRSDHSDRDASLLRIELGQLLPLVVGLWLEVQVVNFAGGVAARGVFGVSAVSAAGGQRQRHRQGQQECERFFHLLQSPYLKFIFTSSRMQKPDKVQSFRLGAAQFSATRAGFCPVPQSCPPECGQRAPPSPPGAGPGW